MKKSIIPLADHARCTVARCGGKAAVLARLRREGFNVPAGFVISVPAYRDFLATDRLREKIALELSRKDFSEMRWEELWDASLRIRNLFLRNRMPEGLAAAIAAAVRETCPDRPLAIRSSAPAEDGRRRSFAGVHESYLNVSGAEEVLKHVRLVWASLWSDAALAYRRELALDVNKSAMAVLVQELVSGDRSGVAFGVSPVDGRRMLIECVDGLNKGLVDGEIEPEQWFLDRRTGRVLERRAADRKDTPVPAAAGGGIMTGPQARRVGGTVRRLEEMLGAPQDVEWTFSGRKLYLLQSRPITTLKRSARQDRRDFDLGLRRSFAALKNLAEKIEGELLPAMDAQALALGREDLSGLEPDQLDAAIEARRQALDHWRQVYWSDFIPFAHGTRLFGEVYNDRLAPEDPYQFLELLGGAGTMGVERNRRLVAAARQLKKVPGGRRDGRIERLAEELGLAPEEARALVVPLLERLAAGGRVTKPDDDGRRAALEAAFIASFKGREKNFGREILALAKKSYRLRDDDNLHLGALEKELKRARREKSRRSGGAGENTRPAENAPKPDEAAAARERARQLRGQSAGRGIARGRARVIRRQQDLFSVQPGEIIVCDAVDPGITFVIPLAAAIVERRGGMLVHGAIIAREYGLPCVTGIPRATEVIADGDEITVDGFFGLVTNHSV